jgi:ATP-dependent DNA ligase
MSPKESLDPRTTQPMEAVERAEVPAGDGWQYEPKWDGFRCLAFRRGDDVELWSKAGKPLSRYFPDVVEAVAELPGSRFVLDGELVIPVEGRLSFDDLLLRIHPAETRVRALATAHPATYVVFDLLEDDGHSLLLEPLSERRARLERFAKRMGKREHVELSPSTRDRDVAGRWLREAGSALDGIVAKRVDAPYLMGDRRAMVKVKKRRTADCVVGGFRRT